MRVKYSDSGAALPLYTRKPFRPVDLTDPMDQSSHGQLHPQHDSAKRSLSSMQAHTFEDEKTLLAPFAPDSSTKSPLYTSRRRLDRRSDSKDHDHNDAGPASNSHHKRPHTRFSDQDNSSRPTRSSGRHSNRVLDLSTKKGIDRTSTPLTTSSSDTIPALIRFTDESLDRSEFTTVEHVGDDQYIVTGTNWRWETSFPVTTSGDLRTLIHTFEDNTCPPSQPILPQPHMNRGGATRSSDKESASTSDEVPDLTMGSSPPQQPSPSPPPRNTPKCLPTPRPSSGRVPKPTAKLRGMDSVRRTTTRTSGDRESSLASDKPSEVRGSAAPESNASGLKIQLKRTSPAPSGIRLYLKTNGADGRGGRRSRAVVTGEREDEQTEQEEQESEAVTTRASKRAKFVKT